MSTIEKRLSTQQKSRRKDAGSQTTAEAGTASVSRDIYVLCDGAIKKSGNTANSRILVKSHIPTSGRDRLKQAKPEKVRKSSKKNSAKQLTKADRTPLNTITSQKSLIWLQKLDNKRLAVQWNVPNNIQRNCQDLLLNGEKSEFVLRLYQNISVGHSEWKTSQRTLEYPIDILRRKCYINLENSGGGIFTAEIGVRAENSRYIFLARSNKCSTPGFNPEPENKEIRHSRSFSKKQVIKTPKVFKSKSRLDHSRVADFQLRGRDIIAESLVNGLYTDFLNEGPKVLRRSNEKIVMSSVASRADYLNSVKQTARNQSTKPERTAKKDREKLKSRRLDQYAVQEEQYQNTAINNYPEKPRGYIPDNLNKQTAANSGVMIASMLNVQGTVAIDVFKKGENPSPSGKNRKVVKVKSKQALAKAMKKSGLPEKSELILKGKLEPGRKVRVGGLLIDTEADGSFYVSCSIINGKLHVPVEEIEAIITE